MSSWGRSGEHGIITPYTQKEILNWFYKAKIHTPSPFALKNNYKYGLACIIAPFTTEQHDPT